MHPHSYLGAHEAPRPAKQIGSAVFAGLAVVPNAHTGTLTTKRGVSVTIGRIYAAQNR